jgi:hypothetical protein
MDWLCPNVRGPTRGCVVARMPDPATAAHAFAASAGLVGMAMRCGGFGAVLAIFAGLATSLAKRFSPRTAQLSARSAQLVEQRFGVPQIGGVEPSVNQP